MLSLYKIVDGGAETLHSLHLHVGPILDVSFTANSSSIYTTGADGTVFVTNITGGATFEPTLSSNDFDFKASEMANVDLEPKTASTSEPTWLATNLQVLKENQEQEAQSTKNSAIEGVKDLSSRLRALLAADAAAPDIEKMDRSEFVIDVKGRDLHNTKNLENSEEARKNIKDEDMVKDMISARIRQECWDSMIDHASEVRGLMSDNRVRNFPVAKLTQKEKRQLEIVKRLRMGEIMDIRRNLANAKKGGLIWKGLVDEISADCNWIINASNLKATDDCHSIKEQLDAFVGNEGEKKTDDSNDKKEKDGEDNYDNEGEDNDGNIIVDEKNLLNMLYHPLAVRNDHQRKSQMVMLKELCRMIAMDFNKEFEKLKNEKEDVVGQIEGRNERIHEILVELKSDEDYFKPTIHKSEIVDSVLTISEGELKTTEYESKADREARLKKEEDARIAAEMNKGDDAPTRALDDMMGGTLEVKKEVLTTDSLVRQDWMDVLSFEEMTPEQKKEVDEYEAQSKAIADALEKQRKALELELKKLRSEVNDLIKIFDEKVLKIDALRTQIQSSISTQELYLARLGSSIMRKEDCEIDLRKVDDRIVGLIAQRDLLNKNMGSFQKNLDDATALFNAAQEADKAIERNFRKDIQEASSAPLDQDSVKVLLGLFKKRSGGVNGGSGATSTSGYRNSGGMSSNRQSIRRNSLDRKSTLLRGSRIERGSMSRRRTSQNASRKSFGSLDGNDLGPLQAAMKEAQLMAQKGYTNQKDPFLKVDEALEKRNSNEGNRGKGSKTVSGRGSRGSREGGGAVAQLAPLDIDLDLPEGFKISDGVWDKLQELRQNKWKTEQELDAAYRANRVAQKQFDRVSLQETALTEIIEGLDKRKDGLLEKDYVLGQTLEVLTLFKQGQDEVEQGAVVTDYSDCKLIPLSLIRDTNALIKELGAEKVKILNRTKKFRQRINFMNWEHQYLEKQAADMSDHYTDLQLMRVTKQLKMVMSGTKMDSDKVKAERSEIHMSKLMSTHNDKVEKLTKANRKLMIAIKDRISENARLEKQLKELESNVGIRENIYKSRIESSGGVVDASARAGIKMKRVTMRRKLIDLARAQTDEVEFLRQELDRLRKKTFPSFAQAAEERLGGNPDELMEDDMMNGF